MNKQSYRAKKAFKNPDFVNLGNRFAFLSADVGELAEKAEALFESGKTLGVPANILKVLERSYLMTENAESELAYASERLHVAGGASRD